MLIYNTSTTSKRSLWPPEKADVWVTDAYKSSLRLSDGLTYDDWCSGLGANTLGYGKYVDDFSAYDARWRPAASLPWNIERDFADEFCQAMGTEAVRFFKSGSDSVSCAVRLARAYKKRPKIAVFDKSYHGTGDWFGPALWTQGGIINYGGLVIWPFGEDISKDTRLKQIAAIVVEPVPKGIDLPPAGWLEHLREVCDEYGILLISDEVILGYRHSLRGYLASSAVQADLYCYGKAMAQGAALSACTGRDAIMRLLHKEVHFSGTNNGEPLPLMIAQATLKEYQDKNICHTLNYRGSMLRSLLYVDGFETRGLDSRFEVVFDSPEQRMNATRFLWDRQILFSGFCSMAVTHSTDQMQRLVEGLKCWRESLS